MGKVIQFVRVVDYSELMNSGERFSKAELRTGSAKVIIFRGVKIVRTSDNPHILTENQIINPLVGEDDLVPIPPEVSLTDM